MTFYPAINLTLLNGFLLMLPLIALRFGLPALIDKTTIAKLAYFPPVEGVERTWLNVYFVSNTFLIFSPLLARIQTGTAYATTGWVIYALGIVLLILSLLHFSKADGVVKQGIYRYSRNPMYIAYFLIFIGTAFLIGSWFHLILTVIYQISVHWLILSEERWCREQFGEGFAEYERKVPRYL